MGRFCFWAALALVVLLCRIYSFWAVFGWGYAMTSVVLIVVCFTHNRRRKGESDTERTIPVLTLSQEQQ
ncbi:MAG: hypothetical protein FIB02_05965 [Desulfuromonas sp.]|nr:hypothetical protein [Desulfuromonas sp.]